MIAALQIVFLGAVALFAAGIIGIVAWVYDRRIAATHRAARELAFVLQASTEVCNLAADREFRDALQWTPAEEAAYQRSRAREREIAASKRGDLLEAARFAELSEVDRG